MIETLAAMAVWSAASYLVVLGVMLLLRPAQGRRFLAGFAQTASAHYLELGLRILIGAALITHAPSMAASSLFVLLGWVLIATSVGLALMPWRWHARIAQRSVTMATHFSALLGFASISLGAGLAFALLAARAS
jgi:hypothetical protein